MKKRLIISLILLVVAAGCGSNSLSRSKAASVIRGSDPFKHEEDAVFNVGGLSGIVAGSRYKALESLGYAKITNRGWYDYFDLTDRGTEAVSTGKWKKGVWVNGFTVSIPVVSRELIEITGVTQEKGGNQAQVEFTWKYSLNDFGRQLQAAGATFTGQMDKNNGGAIDVHGTFKATGTLQLYDDGWRATDQWRGL